MGHFEKTLNQVDNFNAFSFLLVVSTVNSVNPPPKLTVLVIISLHAVSPYTLMNCYVFLDLS